MKALGLLMTSTGEYQLGGRTQKHVLASGGSSLRSSLETNGHDRSQSSVPQLPGMPKLKKVSFNSLESRSQASSPGKILFVVHLLCDVSLFAKIEVLGSFKDGHVIPC